VAGGVKTKELVLAGPRRIEIEEHLAPTLTGAQVLVQTWVSAISAGTELLLYRGEAPPEMQADGNLPALAGTLAFPLRYGYSAVGEVIALGPAASAELLGRTVFAYHPHASHFPAAADELFPLPPDLPPEAGLFLPNMETAINFLHDGAPLAGERVVVFGQGVVGLLTTALLARTPLGTLITVDPDPVRRAISLEFGAGKSLAPSELEGLAEQADLTYELSGDPQALDQAIAVTGFEGRVVLGSWYGTKQASLNLGGRFHRSRIRLLSSQVSTIASTLTGRWDKRRRLEFGLQMVRAIEPARLITHRIPIEQAAEAYALLDTHREHVLQVVLTYDS
jgi:2-desacetyl-2-hydroxyethyl bacteriochlorophyllide A dehydrogenase